MDEPIVTTSQTVVVSPTSLPHLSGKFRYLSQMTQMIKLTIKVYDTKIHGSVFIFLTLEYSATSSILTSRYTASSMASVPTTSMDPGDQPLPITLLFIQL